MKVQMLSQMINGIACLGFIGYLATVVIVNNFSNPTGLVSIIKYIVFAVFIIAAVVFWFVGRNRRNQKNLMYNKWNDVKGKIDSQSPLIHCNTGPIAINDCANAVLALEQKPICAETSAGSGKYNINVKITCSKSSNTC